MATPNGKVRCDGALAFLIGSAVPIGRAAPPQLQRHAPQFASAVTFGQRPPVGRRLAEGRSFESNPYERVPRPTTLGVFANFQRSATIFLSVIFLADYEQIWRCLLGGLAVIRSIERGLFWDSVL